MSGRMKKRKEYYKREPSKQIIFTHPNERLLADLTELPYDLKYNNNYQYLLNIIDHFSKYSWCYLLTNKKAYTVFKYINDCFNIIGFPEHFGNDNGTEFAILYKSIEVYYSFQKNYIKKYILIHLILLSI